MRTVDPSVLAPVDVVAFGSPCQDLSVAGKRSGLDGERSGLFHEAIRIISGGHRPVFAVWENVPGTLNSNHGDDFAAVLAALVDAGALDIAWRVLDARGFGVPQRRRRLFVVADFGGERAGPILFGARGRGRHPGARGPQGIRATAPARGGVASDALASSEILGAYRKAVRAGTADDYETWVDDGFVNTVNAFEGHNSIRATSLVVHRHTLMLCPYCAGSGEACDPSTGQGPVCPACHGKGAVRPDADTVDLAGDDPTIETLAVRRTTPREHERFQGFPDDWTRWRADGSEIPDGTRYRLVGNAVAVPVAAWIAQGITEALGVTCAT